ncbi:MAG: hypothetical protein EP347_00215 [Alphaproteobacteria bacterium]|nr:MAG: hypothetical protein EP347_00215 [Alphaproteobacteria bacterium]
MTDEEDETGSLLEGIKSTPPTKIRSGFEKVEGLSPEEEEELERGGKHAVRGTIRRAGRYFIWALWGVLCVIVVVFGIGVIVLLSKYLFNVMGDLGKTETFLIQVWDNILLVLATLFLESFVGRKD